METVTMKSGYLHSSQPLCGGDNVAHGANEYFCLFGIYFISLSFVLLMCVMLYIIMV